MILKKLIDEFFKKLDLRIIIDFRLIYHFFDYIICFFVSFTLIKIMKKSLMIFTYFSNLRIENQRIKIVFSILILKLHTLLSHQYFHFLIQICHFISFNSTQFPLHKYHLFFSKRHKK